MTKPRGFSIWLLPIVLPIALLSLIKLQNQAQTQTALELMGKRLRVNARVAANYLIDVAGTEFVFSERAQRRSLEAILSQGHSTVLRFVMAPDPSTPDNYDVMRSVVLASSDRDRLPVEQYEAKTRGDDITEPPAKTAIELYQEFAKDHPHTDYSKIYESEGKQYALTVIHLFLVDASEGKDGHYRLVQLFAISELTQEIYTLQSQQVKDSTLLAIGVVLALGSVAMLIAAPAASLAKSIALDKPLPKNRPWTSIEQQRLTNAIGDYQAKIGDAIKQIDLSTTALFVVNWDGVHARIHRPNKALTTITGYPQDELEGMLLNGIVPEPFHKYHQAQGGEWSEEFSRILGMGSYLLHCPHAKSAIVGASRPVEVIHKNGTIRNVILGVDVLDVGGVFAAALSDVTELTEAIAKSDKYAEEVQRINHIAVHDIKADLIALSKGSEVIGDTVSELEEYLINNTDEVLIDSLDTVKMFADLNINSALNAFEVLDKRNKLYDLDSKIEVKACLVANILEAIKVANGNEQGAFTVEDDCVEGQQVLCDESLFQTVIKNIIRNGFLHNESVLKSVAVKASLEAKKVVFTIKDNGVGIPADYLKDWGKTLGKSAQLSTDRGGSGTGLYSIKAIMNAHKKYGGAVEIASELGNGTQFTLILKAVNGDA